jgi:predicted nucleotidyltransferase
MVKSKNDIVEAIQRHADELSAFGIHSLRLFGSFAQGNPRRNSDVDLLVEFGPDMKCFDNLVGAAFLLEGLFQRKVELVTPGSLSTSMRQIIMASSEYVFRRN